jgi:hypothetical protein
MVKDSTAASKPEEKEKDHKNRNIVNKIMKTKNRFRSGLGFKNNKNLGESLEGNKLNQTTTRKKILQGTKTAKGEDGEREAEEEAGEARPAEGRETGARNKGFDVEEDEYLARSKLLKRQSYYDPRARFQANQ